MSKCVYKGVKFVQNNASKSIIGVKDCNSVFHFSADKILSDSELRECYPMAARTQMFCYMWVNEIK